ncbi:peptidase, partial [Verrucomicrobia bacterium]|nr:peptidase [Verrucomicrobiota bacterium]
RRVGTWSMRGMAFGGIRFVELSDSERRPLGLTGDKLALKAEHVGQYNKHAAAKRAGWKKGDVLIGVERLRSRLSESELIGLILQKHSPGKKIRAQILRGRTEMNLHLPVQ